MSNVIHFYLRVLYTNLIYLERRCFLRFLRDDIYYITVLQSSFSIVYDVFEILC